MSDEYELRLCAVPGNWRVPPACRLRALLKTALRGYGFRCLSARPFPATGDNFPRPVQAGGSEDKCKRSE